MNIKAEGAPRVCHHVWKKTPASLGYPPSVFNKNSSLKCKHGDRKNKEKNHVQGGSDVVVLEFESQVSF